MESREIKIVMSLNADDTSLVLAALQTAREMLSKSMDLAIEDGLLPVVRLAKDDIARIDKIIEDTADTHSYTSKSFIIDEQSMRDKERKTIEITKMLEDVMSKREAKEKGEEWDKAGDNVVSILDKFKKDEPDVE